jgi:hypothetical protein
MAGVHLSKDFFDLIKTIGEAKSKQVRVLRVQSQPAPGVQPLQFRCQSTGQRARRRPQMRTSAFS